MLFKRIVKTALRSVVPNYYVSLMAARENRHGQRVMEKSGVPTIAAAILDRHGPQVLSGPFAGMTYLTQSIGSSFIPKLIGSYEQELHGILGQILACRYDIVADVGSAEGYYAVGLAMRLPGKPKIYAFDIDSKAQELCRLLSQKNGVEDQIVISGYCDPQRLEETLTGNALVVCDCEGYEVDLLQPTLAPSLKRTDILVELHDICKPGITPVILDRFRESHHIQLLDTVDRDASAYPAISFLEPEQQRVAVSEFRNGPQQWAFMTPKQTEDGHYQYEAQSYLATRNPTRALERLRKPGYLVLRNQRPDRKSNLIPGLAAGVVLAVVIGLLSRRKRWER